MPSSRAAPIACPNAQVKAILELRLHRLTALGRDEIGDELNELAIAIAGYLAILADRVKLYAVMRAGAGGDPRSLRHPAPVRDRTGVGRARRRGPDRARRDGRDGHPRRLHQAHPALDLPRAASRRQGPRRHGDEGRRRGDGDVRHLDAQSRCCSSRPRAKSIASRSGSCPKAARPRAGGRSSTCCRARRRRDDRHRPCRCPRTRTPGARSMSSSPRPRATCGATRWSLSPTSRQQRQVRHALRGRERGPADRRAPARSGRRRAARHAPGQGDPLRRRGCSRIPEPHQHRRARHEAQGRRRGRLAVASSTVGTATPEERDAYLRVRPVEGRRRTPRRYRTSTPQWPKTKHSSSPSAPMATAR